MTVLLLFMIPSVVLDVQPTTSHQEIAQSEPTGVGSYGLFQAAHRM